MSGSTTGTTVSSLGSGGTGETSIRVVIFSGKKEDWETWKEKFMVRASIRGYEAVLTGDDEVPETIDDNGDKKTLSADDQLIAEANKKGYGDLILLIDCTTSSGKVAFAIVKGSKTKSSQVVISILLLIV
jgi:hypothetical protein